MRSAAQILPLTHFLNASRAIMLDGATLFDVMPKYSYAFFDDYRFFAVCRVII